MPAIIQLAIFLGLLLVTFITGKTLEVRHFRSIKRREAELDDMMVTNLKTPPGTIVPSKNTGLVLGQAVITADYFKTYLSGFRKIFGGEMKGYKTLMERAEREAMLRMLEQADSKKCNAVCNVRLEFSNIGGMTKKNMVAVEVLASGTAYCVQNCG